MNGDKPMSGSLSQYNVESRNYNILTLGLWICDFLPPSTHMFEVPILEDYISHNTIHFVINTFYCEVFYFNHVTADDSR